MAETVQLDVTADESRRACAPLDFEPLPPGTSFKILFVYPNMKYRRPHLGLAVLAACVKKIGAEALLCDLTVVPPGLRTEVLRTQIRNTRPDLVALTTMSVQWSQVIKLINVCKDVGVPHIVGGPQPTEVPEDTIGVADILVVGEGEGAIMDVVRAMARSRPLTGIPNTWVRCADGRVVATERRHLIEDLDNLPFPDWQLFHPMHYDNPDGTWSVRMKPDGSTPLCAAVESGRGCPYECSYCSNSARMESYAGKGRWRREKSARRLIEELHSFKQSMGQLDHVIFIDDVFLTGEKRLAEFCELYRGEVGVPFSIRERPELVTDRKVRMASEAGLTAISFGFESGDELFRKEVLNRGTPDRIVQRAFRLPKRYGVRTCAYLMVGLPGQNERSLLQTWRGLRAASPDFAFAFVYRPVRGTALYDECVRRGLHDPKKDMLPWGPYPIMKHDKLDDATIMRYYHMMMKYGAGRGLWSTIAFHLGRRWDWACRWLMKESPKPKAQIPNSEDGRALKGRPLPTNSEAVGRVIDPTVQFSETKTSGQ